MAPILHLSQTTVAETNNRQRKQEKKAINPAEAVHRKLEQRDIVVQGSIQAQQRHLYRVIAPWFEY
jgi:hypothetical protein